MFFADGQAGQAALRLPSLSVYPQKTPVNTQLAGPHAPRSPRYLLPSILVYVKRICTILSYFGDWSNYSSRTNP